MNDMEEIAALNAEARRRGMSYGKLAASVSLEERADILHKFREEKARKARRRGKKEDRCPVKVIKRAVREPTRRKGKAPEA